MAPTLEEVLERLDAGIVILEAQGHVLAMNGLAQHRHGFRRAASLQEALGASNSTPWLQTLEIARTEAPVEVEIDDPAGTPARVSASTWPDGRVLLSMRPLDAPDDERLAAYEEVLARYGIGLWRLEAETGRLWWSPKCYDLVGLDPGPVTTESFLRAVHPDDQHEIGRSMSEAYAGAAAYEPKFRVVLPDGQHRHLQDRAIITRRDAGGLPLLAFGATMDRSEIAELKERNASLERRLDALERLGVAGRMASTIAHDLNNVMTVIVGNTELLQDKAGTETDEVSEILHAARHASELASRLLDTVRMRPSRLVVSDLAASVARLEKFLNSLIPEQSQLQLRVPSEPCWVRMDPRRIEQALYNLVLNAAEASGAEGRIFIEVSDHDRWVQLSVRDDGPGIDPEVQEQLFEPFVSTREQGMGLGLASVRAIAQQHGGDVTVESEPGEGTVFRLHFPRSDVEAVEVQAGGEAPVRRSARVWVVEDQPLVRVLVERLLTGAGHEVRCFPEPSRALEALDASSERPELVLTDVVMPRMTGPELAAKIGLRAPDVRILYMSGYAGPMRGDQGLELGNVPLLHKPFTTQALLEAVDRALNP